MPNNLLLFYEKLYKKRKTKANIQTDVFDFKKILNSEKLILFTYYDSEITNYQS